MSELIRHIQRKAEALEERILAIRRHLHAHPELSYREFETAEYIRSQLDELNIPYREEQTGTIARIQGEKKEDGKVTSRNLALRADIDALPVLEANDIPFKSTREGVMHACGHDAHSAVLLGAASILQSLRHEFSGTLNLIFQPAEEKSPGGAKNMIAAGALESMNSILGEHVNPGLPAGKVGFRSGLMMASADEIYMTVHGKGGHAAAPHSVIDPVLISSHIIVALQQIVSRMANPDTPSVLSFGKVDAPGAMNVIPSSVRIEGTFRTVNEEWRERALGEIRSIAQSLASSMGGSCDLEIIRGYPVLENDPSLTRRSMELAKEYLGEENVVELPLVMWAEDFAYYNREIPGCFYNLGIGNGQKGWTSPLHSPNMMVDESALVTGAGLMAYLALGELNLP
ncbi:M20 metallopeptidase family protein [Salinispira pacifica]|uniref:N-acetyl-L,L-diaminopimelate deacetylase n=1 Tax=Salinispira pacifica TaxID=1307761 RepID=V5WDT2_9SPIO|nr:M20 family metallopeptidase [Salinispira pacifica]AHC13724.1 N-acetyl-L,L-diaminopimelate deacetylase [Salinispira pacifica]